MSITWNDPRFRPTYLPSPIPQGFWRSLWAMVMAEPEPKPWRRLHSVADSAANMPDPYAPPSREPDELVADIAKVIEEIKIDPLDDLRQRIRALNYGEMKAFCEGIGNADMDDVWAFATEEN